MNARLLSMLGALVACLLLAAPAHAGLTITPGSFSADSFAKDGSVEARAGIHPYRATTSFDFETTAQGEPSGSARNLRMELPAGFVGNPEATTRCPREAISVLANRNSYIPECPPDSQVGVAVVTVRMWGADTPLDVAVYNVTPPRGVVAQFGMVVQTVPVFITASVDAARNYSLSIDLTRISQALPLKGSTVSLWGVPNDPVHDDQRFCGASFYPGTPCPVDAPRIPFLTNPSACEGPLTSTMKVDSWQEPGVTQTATYQSAAIVGCDQLAFTPRASVEADTTAPDAPSGLSVKLTMPQRDDPQTGLAPPPLRDTTVTLPEGMTINPGSAGGLEACTDAQLGLGNSVAVSCPESAKIGTVTATTPVLAEPLKGSVYLRTQASGDPESGDMFRMAIVLENQERGLLFKLPGQVKANATTGRLETSFRDNPQMPVSSLDLTLKSGPRAMLVTPTMCGEKTVAVQMTSWAGQVSDLTDTMSFACAGLGGFAPAFRAGTGDPSAGAFSPFALSITKPDRDAALSGLSMSLPAGLLARLKGNLGTQVGTVKAYSGPGASPYMLPGQVYLEGAYGDAPFSLKVVVPAKAGPLDLGTVVVRQKIYVDPIDAHVTVVSDPLPTIVSGVPVRLQRLDVSVDKSDFMVNPTSCAAKRISATLSAIDGRSVPVTNRFQVGACAALDLKPSLALSLSGKGQTVDGKHPAVTASLTQPAGQSNLTKVRVALPLSLALDTDNANGLCEFVDGSKVTPTCPKASIVGTATAVSPILDEPLSGPVYFVKNVRKDPKSGRDIRTLPKLVIPLIGQNGVKLTLTGTSDVEDDQLVTTFDNIPDAPVSSFKLNINGGKGGILAVSDADICKATQIAEQQVDGQNGKGADAEVSIQTPSCPLKVLSKKVGKSSVALKVGGLGAGKVTVNGRGIKKTTKTITKSTVATITARRTKGTLGKVTVSYDPTGPAKARKTTK